MSNKEALSCFLDVMGSVEEAREYIHIRITKAWELRVGLGNPNTPLQAGTFCDVSFGCFIWRKLRRDSRSRKSGLGKGVRLRYISIMRRTLPLYLGMTIMPYLANDQGLVCLLSVFWHRSSLFYKYLMTRGDSHVPGYLSPSRVESSATKLSLHGGFEIILLLSHGLGCDRQSRAWGVSCSSSLSCMELGATTITLHVSVYDLQDFDMFLAKGLNMGCFYGSYDNLSNNVWPLEKEPWMGAKLSQFEIHKFNARVNGKREHQEDYIMRRLISSAFARWFRP
ncbi:hypothetical protein BGY98DRAFT_935717 [Russula aff. rugulosa BPL654]|nr:hypothetical protein BGY98DRAFT_935717 [Russula aff. rugulosa BPL654]